MDQCELAWAAGFFDREGWANATGNKERRTRQPRARINQADPNGIPEVLVRFQRAVGGIGRIGGPYLKDGRQDLYRWEVSSRGDVELLHHLLLSWLGQVKLQAFGKALSRSAAQSRAVDQSDHWRAWAAGFYDGEGSTYLLDHRSHPGYRISQITVSPSSTAGPPQGLLRLADVTGVGHVNGPYIGDEGAKDVYRLKTSAQDGVRRLIASVWRWLSAVKRDQATIAFTVLDSQPHLPRGRPDWGNRKTRCIRGHESATSRIRPYRPRAKGIQRRDSHQCLVCVREQARARRQKKKVGGR